MTDKPRWVGGISEARRIAANIVDDHQNDHPTQIIEKVAEALVDAFDNGVHTESCAREEPKYRLKLLTELLYEHGIGIATLEETKARTEALARGEIKCLPGDPKLWFSSIEVFIGWVKTKANLLPEKE